MLIIFNWLCLILSIVSVAFITIYPFWTKKSLPKKWAIIIGSVIIAAQLGNEFAGSRQQAELKSAIDKSASEAQNLSIQLKVQDNKLMEAQNLIKRFASNVNNQALKQEADLYNINRTVSDLSNKTSEQTNDQYRHGGLNDKIGPLDKIADSFHFFVLRLQKYFEDRELAEIRLDTRMQSVKYLQLIKDIPAEYDDVSWKASEAVIYEMLSSEISSNLHRRNIYTPEAYKHDIVALEAERARLLQMRARLKK